MLPWSEKLAFAANWVARKALGKHKCVPLPLFSLFLLSIGSPAELYSRAHGCVFSSLPAFASLNQGVALSALLLGCTSAQVQGQAGMGGEVLAGKVGAETLLGLPDPAPAAGLRPTSPTSPAPLTTFACTRVRRRAGGQAFMRVRCRPAGFPRPAVLRAVLLVGQQSPAMDRLPPMGIAPAPSQQLAARAGELSWSAG